MSGADSGGRAAGGSGTAFRSEKGAADLSDGTGNHSATGRRVVGGVFGFVLVMDLLLVALAGTDIPFHDQWDIEGRWLYPGWLDGSLSAAGLVQPFNEHRILWTHLLNLALFSVNGQWDPLVQCVAIAFLRAACAAGIAGGFSAAFAGGARWVVGAVVAVAFLPHLAWHMVLWGIQSHSYFVLGFSFVALALLGTGAQSPPRTAAGIVAGIAALFAMGPGALVPVALIGLWLLRAIERRGIERGAVAALAVAGLLLGAALWLRVDEPGTAEWRPANIGAFVVAAGRALAWPHVGSPIAALVLNAPLLAIVLRRAKRERRAVAGEDFVLLAGGWSVGVALATAWMRGGGAELGVGVPSRYVDFLLPLPLANLWCALVLAREAAGAWRRRVRWATGAWAVFLAIGWIGLSTEVMRRLILPRVHDREAPVRLMQAYQATGDVGVFAGQPRLLVPHPDPASSVRPVLADPRLRGRLPPSLQPTEPLGPLSRWVRAGREAAADGRRQ